MVSRKAFPAELRERAVKMVLELRAESGGGRGAVAQVGRQLGINPETLRNWVSQAESIPGTGRARRRRTGRRSRSWSARCVSCGGRMRS